MDHFHPSIAAALMAGLPSVPDPAANDAGRRGADRHC
jgi:hypothetical protein